MTGETSRQLLRATQAIAKNLGVRFCVKCNLTRAVEGGKLKVLAGGRTRWECATCAAKMKPPGIGRKTK